ncbi:MAG: hypothetical protein B6I35_09740 [Anaerolineaceae bacterium 4572_32.2]|nr:MAG: hypothetical protein B6I35_09740 [Anaerolineaceae bacterium 4572_32.2]
METRRPNWLQKRIGQLVNSRLIGWIANLPPVAWVSRTVVRVLVKRRAGKTPVEESLIGRVVGSGLEATLEQIVYDVVEALGYTGAMVATYEQGDSLPVRALYVSPNLATLEQIHKWETEISKYTEQPVSITDPDIARVFVYQDEYKDNLSVRAFKAGGPVASSELYYLFTPIAPLASRPLVAGIQQALGIQEVIAVPFFLETLVNGQLEREIVGNLFVAKQGPISQQDKLVLSAFGRQAAAAIKSERRRLHIQVAQEIVFEMQSSLHDEVQILQQIVEGVVSDLGYVGAMVATYEPDDSLPVRALCISPDLATMEQIHEWETEISKYTKQPVSITDPAIARVFVYQDECRHNLSVRAFRAGGPVTSDALYDLFTPIAPPASKPVVGGIQQALGIQQVIAVPFFLRAFTGGRAKRECVGNLFAATRSKKLSAGEIELLKAFAQQAAVGIRNAQLYRKAEERRQVAQVFGKMAFSAAAFVHKLRNHIAAFQTHLHLVQVAPPDRRDEILALSDKMRQCQSRECLAGRNDFPGSSSLFCQVGGLRMKLFAPPDVKKLKAENNFEGLLKALAYKEDLHVRWDAAEALGQMGEVHAVKALVAALKDIRWAAASALKEIGEPALGTLITALNDADASNRQVTAWALGQMGDPRTVNSLIVALQDDSAAVRWTTAGALGKIGDDRAAKPLIALLADPDGSVREAAAGALGRIGDKLAAEPLLIALKDRDRRVRERASEALAEIGILAVKPLIGVLKSINKDACRLAARALGKIGDTRAVQPLVAILENPDASMRQSAAQALGRIGDLQALKPLIVALGDLDEGVRQAAAWALGRIGDKQAVRSLITALGDSDASVRETAAEALGRIGDTSATGPLIAIIENIDEHIDERVRRAAAEALGQIGDAKAVEALAAALKGAESGLCKQAAGALGKIGIPAVEPLVAALKDANKIVRWAAAEALGQIGVPRVVAPLVAALEDTDKDVRKAAAEALGQAGVTWSVRPLIAALEDEAESVRWAVARALGQIDDTRAVEPLVAALRDSNWIKALDMGVRSSGFSRF